MPRLLSDLLQLPERVHRGDFVLNLSGGVQDPDATASSYVVTPQLKTCFHEALGFIQSAIDSGGSKATYLHGSFGSGKSHFMAILYLLLENHPAVTKMPDLAEACAAAPWRTEKRCLLVPYHMIGAADMESAILGGYVDYVRKHHPEAPLPGVYRAEAIFEDAKSYRERLGDEKFFELLGGSGGDAAESSGWGDIDTGWNAERFEAALAAPPGTRNEERARLIGDLVEHIFPSYASVARGKEESFVSLDEGLSILSRHAKSLGYDALILFLDELILWLASHAQNLAFVHREGQKLAKLVESQSSDRPVPIVSFVARQRDLRELVGEAISGAEQLGFGDALKHWEGRFHSIVLEDRNLPVIAEKRVLRPKSDAARSELDQAFRETEKVRAEVMDILLTREADATMFRQVYPFSPALVQCLVAVSSALQRERTALKIMMQLLVKKRATLEVGQVVPVGDLWDEVAQGEEAFIPGMRRQFEMAQKLWHLKLRPLLEEEHEVSLEHDQGRAAEDEEIRLKLERFEKDSRLLKTLLLAALVPEVAALKNLTPARLAALNHGSIRSPIPGREGQIALDKLKKWNGTVGELKISQDSANPTISLQLAEVDTDSILESAQIQDNPSNRQRKLRTMLFDAMGVDAEDKLIFFHDFTWRGTKRQCELSFYNVRDAALSGFENEDENWKLVIDFPFDSQGHSPQDDLAKLEEFRQTGRSARTLAWIPEFFSREMQAELGKLVVIDYLLLADNLSQHTKHLSLQDRATAKQLLENRRNALRSKVLLALEGAYGINKVADGMLDSSFELERDKFQSLMPGFQPQPVVAPDFARALDHLLGQALEWQFPDHPKFLRDIKRSELSKILEVCLAANHDPNRRTHVEDKKLRPVLAMVAEPLGLGRMRENLFVLDVEWKERFSKQLAASGRSSMDVLDLRRWTDEPRPRGLPRDVEDLLILVYAAQAQRSFYLHAGPCTASIGDLRDEVELRSFEGPPEDEWKRAQDVGGHVFGVAASKLLDPENLARFVAAVGDQVARHASAARGLPKLLRDTLIGLGVEESEILRSVETHASVEGDATYARFVTALAVAELVEALAGKGPNELVHEIATATPRTSAAAMGNSLKSAEKICRALDGGDWDIFRAIRELTDDRKATADEIIAELCAALAADEVALPLLPKLEVCRRRALQLLTKAAPPPPPTAAPTPAPAAKQPPSPAPTPTPAPPVGLVEEGREASVDAERLAAFAEDLAEKLAKDGRLRLDLTWQLRREGEES